jgi:hypothetical protein
MGLMVILITLTPTKAMDITDLPVFVMEAGNRQILVFVDL